MQEFKITLMIHTDSTIGVVLPQDEQHKTENKYLVRWEDGDMNYLDADVIQAGIERLKKIQSEFRGEA